MIFFRILDVDPVDGVAIVLCLITIWWCVRYAPRGPRTARVVLAVLGVLSAYLGTRYLDAMISAAFLLAAIMLEISPRRARLECVEEFIPPPMEPAEAEPATNKT
jgi:hypothetical protein